MIASLFTKKNNTFSNILSFLSGKILLFRVFHLTNVPQLVMVAWYAFVFNLLDLLVFISLYPATLALYIELSHCEGKANRWDPKAMVAKLKRLVDNEDHSPVVHR